MLLEEYWLKAKRFFFKATQVWYFLIAISITVLLGILYILPRIESIGGHIYRNSIAVNIICDAIAALLLSLFLFTLWSLFSAENLQSIELVDCDDSLKKHRMFLKKTNFWYHDGHLGKWVREKVYPEFIKKKKDKKLSIKLLILNPLKPATIKNYSLYRKRINEDKKGFQNDKDTIREILLTILISQKTIVEGNGFIDIEVFLREDFNIVRRDFSSNCFFETVAARHSHAIIYNNNFDLNSNHDYYSTYKQDFEERLKNDSTLNKILFLTETEYRSGQVLEDLILKNSFLRVIDQSIIQNVKQKHPDIT